jgi:DNA-binding beta-propeller fold protein YncE
MYGGSGGSRRARKALCAPFKGVVRKLLVLWVFSWLVSFGTPASATEHDLCLDGGTAPLLDSAQFLRSYRAGLHAPSRLALDRSGNVYASDPARNQLIARGPDGRLLLRQVFPSPANAIAVDDEAGRPLTFYVGEDSTGRVSAYSADWVFLHDFGQGAGEFVSVNDIAVDPVSGSVYVVDSGADLVKMFSADGTFLGSFGGQGSEPGEFDFPVALAIDPGRQELLVADQLNYRIQIFDLDGNFICRLGNAGRSSPGCPFFCNWDRLFTAPQGLAVDDQGRIYVADAAEGRIRVVDRDGTPLGEIAAFGEGPDRLRVPLDLVIDSHGRLFVTDSNNGRLAIYGLEVFTDPEVFAPAAAVFSPDPFDRQGTDSLFTAVIEIPGYPLRDVVLGSITANGVPAVAGSAVIGDADGDLEPDVHLTFERTALAATLPPDGPSPIDVQGQMAELDFHATAFIAVVGGIVDDDGDGVTDDVDLCLGTGPGSAIDATGCAIVQLCPCDARNDGQPWANHGDFASCRAAEALRFADAGIIGRAEIGGVVRAAARAQCPGGS